MIELFTARTPNGIKIPIALEELNIPYEVHKLSLGGAELRSPEFRKINPNAKIPAIRDRSAAGDDDVILFESGAILLYLAETYGGLIGSSPASRARAMSWLFLQVAGLGPAMGNAGHFLARSDRESYAFGRFEGEARRHFDLLETRLNAVEWLDGDAYSIADIAHFSWARSASYAGLDLRAFPALSAWVEKIEHRPATRRAFARLDA